MIQVDVTCPLCQHVGKGEVPEMTILNMPNASMALLVHEKPYLCSNCLGASAYSFANIQAVIGLIPAQHAPGEKKIIVPNGMPKILEGN